MKRRLESIRLRWTFILFVLGFFAQAVAGWAASKPNVVFILADDMGWGDMSRFGCTDYVTTNLDRIGQTGITLTRACAWPVCSPSRAALLTGMDPKRVGVPAVLLPGGNGISTNSYTIAEHLRRAGYATALVGKWHLGYPTVNPQQTPNARGFDYFFGFMGGQINYTNYYYSTEGTNDLWENSNYVADQYQGQYCTRVFTQKALDFINANTNGPFFLLLSYNAPHYPLGNYEPATTAQYSYIPTQNRRQFAAMMRAMDDGVGEILNRIEALGISSNTMVWFMTDNGPILNQGGVAAPFRGEKYTVNEGGVRVPAVVRWPGRFDAPTTNDATFSIVDVFPTLCAALRVPVPETLRMDGTNMLPVLTGAAPPPERPLIFFNDGSYKARALATMDWKYLYTNGAPELYAMPGDLAEATNVAENETALVAEFELALTNQWQAIQRGVYRSHTNVPPALRSMRPPRP